MFDLVVRRVAVLAAAPALFALSAPALAQGPLTPPRPQETPPPTVTATPTPTPSLNPAQIRARAVMVQVVRLTNEERKEAGCPALTVDGHLVTASLRQSNYMARTRLFSHVWRDGSTFVDRSEDSGYRQPAGENIAWGYRSAPEVMEAWMASPGHRRNILNCKAKAFGAGVAFAVDGTPYYTQVFGWQ
ncbi:CAP domain-containing protein [Actinoplanes sichuanensis]|uniref:CAP domain-containing protein n=1 Tax=Actinoplanes sichuanensis TaxID=512349 RepID=A0ABW4AML9_9ACTN|nr:CAP domain-containing protein [Actinoplanes sichuanensis]